MSIIEPGPPLRRTTRLTVSEASRLLVRPLVGLAVGDRFCLASALRAPVYTVSKVEVIDANEKPYGLGSVTTADGSVFVSMTTGLHHPSLGEKLASHVYLIKESA